jgi:CDP-diglyceride synthetase
MLTFIIVILILTTTVFLESHFDVSAPSWLLITGILMAGMAEFNNILRRSGVVPFDWITTLSVPVFMGLVALDLQILHNHLGRGIGLFIFVLALLLAQIQRIDGRGLTNIGGSTLAFLCTVLPGSFLYAIRLEEDGLSLLIYLIATSKMTDNGALFIGTQLGRHKITGRISSGKSIEGMVGGILFAILTAIGLAPLLAAKTIDLSTSLIFGIVIGTLSLLGDLTESLFKREAGLKDSGNLLPGVGGILDLMDSLLLSAPAGYIMIRLLNN